MKTFSYALLLVLLFGYAGFAQNYSPKEYKADYIEACKLFSNKYVYFERKHLLSRKMFFNQQKEYADRIKWDKKTFIEEIRELCALFPDGHVSWEIPRESSPIDGFYTLGFVPSFTLDSQLVVKRTYPHYNNKIQKHDTIISINGTDSKKYIKRLGQKAPQSTPAAT